MTPYPISDLTRHAEFHTAAYVLDAVNTLTPQFQSFGFEILNLENPTYFHATMQVTQSENELLVVRFSWVQDGDTAVTIHSNFEPKQFEYVLKRVKEVLPPLTTQPSDASK